MKRFGIVCAVVAAAALALSLPPAFAAGYPEKPVNLIVGFGAGGSTDIVVRAMNDQMTKNFGQPAVVQNKPGSGGLLAAQTVAKADPDGYNLLVFSLSHILRQAIDPKMDVNVQKDFAPVCRYVTQPLVVVVKGDSRFKTVKDLIDEAKKTPGKVTYGTAGVGATSHFSSELMEMGCGIDMKHVPFKGDAPNITALMGGHIDFLVTGVPIVAGKVASGDLRLLAAFEEKRIPSQKDVPTFIELGYPKVVMYSWFGFVAPAKTPKDVIARADAAFKASIKDKATLDALEKLGFAEAYLGPEDFAKFIASELDRFTKVAKDGSITFQE